MAALRLATFDFSGVSDVRFVGIPLGRLSDKAPRKLILSGGVFAWSLMSGGRKLRVAAAAS
jgi:hypothetical protein